MREKKSLLTKAKKYSENAEALNVVRIDIDQFKNNISSMAEAIKNNPSDFSKNTVEIFKNEVEPFINKKIEEIKKHSESISPEIIENMIKNAKSDRKEMLNQIKIMSSMVPEQSAPIEIQQNDQQPNKKQGNLFSNAKAFHKNLEEINSPFKEVEKFINNTLETVKEIKNHPKDYSKNDIQGLRNYAKVSIASQIQNIDNDKGLGEHDKKDIKTKMTKMWEELDHSISKLKGDKKVDPKIQKEMTTQIKSIKEEAKINIKKEGGHDNKFSHN